MARHRPPKSGWPWMAAALALMVLTVGVAWADHVTSRGETVALNVAYLDHDVSGMSRSQVAELVGSRADEVSSTEVRVDVGDSELSFPAEELGYRYEDEAVVAEIMRSRHTGGLGDRVLEWLASPFRPVLLGDRVSYDPEVAEQRLEDDPGIVLTEPEEPVITMDGEDHLHVIEGVEGGIVDVEDAATRLGSETPATGVVHIETVRSGLPPTVSDEQAQEVADSLNQVTGDGLHVHVGSTQAFISSRLLRRHLEVATADHEVSVRFDDAALHELLERLISEPVTEMAEPLLTVEGDQPVVVRPGKAPLVCCDRESVAVAADLILSGLPGHVHVAARPMDDPSVAAWASGESVIEKVGEFTTRHSCCQSRVTNIHRIADIVRGLYLVPGESVSLNEYVGRRTREKGFVAAGAIRSGHLADEVGGGVSQFATTIFNAAFFSGLDIPDYQAHSLYFSRYPFGREATISHPAPDLVLHNTTEHPILIWTSYTSTSITVSMYSTKHVDVAQVDQRVGSWNRCTYVETDRQRTYPDGLVVVDTFEALYRPADGIDCNGNVIPRT